MKSVKINPGFNGVYEITTGTGRRLVLVGLGDTVEIWTAEAWEAEQERLLYDDDIPCPELTAEQFAAFLEMPPGKIVSHDTKPG